MDLGLSITASSLLQNLVNGEIIFHVRHRFCGVYKAMVKCEFIQEDNQNNQHEKYKTVHTLKIGFAILLTRLLQGKIYMPKIIVAYRLNQKSQIKLKSFVPQENF